MAKLSEASTDRLERLEAAEIPEAKGPVTTEQRPKGAWSLMGIVAGLIGIGCCIYPVTLVLLGLSSAASAIGLGNRLYSEWGWAFKLAGASFLIGAVWIQRKRASSCGARSLGKAAILKATLLALATYTAVYLATKWLAILAS